MLAFTHQEGARRQPRRNRGARHPRLPRMGIATVAVYSDCDRAALHVRYCRRGVAARPATPRESYLRIDADRRRRAARGRRRRASGVRLSRRERGLRGCVPRRGHDLHRSDRATRSVRWAARPPRAQVADGGRRAGRAGHEEPLGVDVPDADDRSASRSEIGYPIMLKAVAGGGGKGMRAGDEPAELAERDPRRALRGAVVVRRRRRLPRAPRCAPAAHRGAAARRSVRHRGAVRRARVFHSAAPPEGDRGESPSLAVTPELRRAIAAAAAARGAGRSATPTRAPSNSCSTRTGSSTSSR